MADDRGRWFRVYARSLRQHPKFRDLSVVELGSWLALRAEAELRDGAVFADRDEAVLVLRRRKVPRPAAVMASLIEHRLFDEADDGVVSVHDRADHDRSELSPEQQTHRRNHRRSEPTDGCSFCLTERWDRNIGDHGAWTPVDGVWTPVDVGGSVDYSTFVDSGLPQQAESSPSHSHREQQAAPAQATAPATADSRQPQQADGLPGEADSATAACRLFANGGRWLGDREYVAAWDDLDRRFSAGWVQAEMGLAYASLHGKSPKVKPWDLVKAVELRCAERTRNEERERSTATARRIAQATPKPVSDEERRRSEVVRRAISLWMKRRPTEPVPTEFSDLESWLEEAEGPRVAPRRTALGGAS